MITPLKPYKGVDETPARLAMEDRQALGLFIQPADEAAFLLADEITALYPADSFRN